MGFFNHYPYTDNYQLNLDFVLRQSKELQDISDQTQEIVGEYTDKVDNLQDNIDQFERDMRSDYRDLEDHVDNYFNNLDVQQEIDNKLDAMSNDGSLGDVIDESGTVPPAVSQWLIDHITQPTVPVIDNTLSVSGAAADAKITGDRINVIENSMFDISTRTGDQQFMDWVGGYWKASDGSWNGSTKYISPDSTLIPTFDGELVVKVPLADTVYNRNNVLISGGGHILITEFLPDGTYNNQYYGSILYSDNIVAAPIKANYRYGISIGQFASGTMSGDNLEDFPPNIDITLKQSILTTSRTKQRTGEYEWFTVQVKRPLPFNNSTVTLTTEIIECVLRLPLTYTTYGKPTRLVLACHGQSGEIDIATQTWYNASWKAFMDDLLAAGYAVFDTNCLPANDSNKGYCWGSPLYVQTIKAAYDYIVNNYNVYDKIFAHGTSMGGTGASAFTHAYPDLVLAESSFAGRDMCLIMNSIFTNALTRPDDIAAVYGYTDYANLTADKFSHAIGMCPSLSMMKYNAGVAELPPERSDGVLDWAEYFGDIYNYGQNDSNPTWAGSRSVPYKTWESWADTTGTRSHAKVKLILQRMFTTGSACPYFVTVYNTYSHTDISYGQVESMRDQLISWFRRWEPDE